MIKVVKWPISVSEVQVSFCNSPEHSILYYIFSYELGISSNEKMYPINVSCGAILLTEKNGYFARCTKLNQAIKLKLVNVIAKIYNLLFIYINLFKFMFL